MQKRGQIYLLAALIIGFILFTLMTQYNVVKKTVIEDDFEGLSKNYERESARFVNELLETNAANFVNRFTKFSVLFTSFSKTKNPDFGLIYVFLYKDNVYVGNYLDTEVTILNLHSGPATLHGCFDKVKTSVSIAGLNIDTPGVNINQFSNCNLPANTPAPVGNKLDIIIEDIKYEVSLTPDNPEIMIVTREEKARQRKVFTKGNFIKGEKA